MARRFRTGRPALDLVHTGGEGEYAAYELLHDAGDVARWLGVIAELDSIEATDEDLLPVRCCGQP